LTVVSLRNSAALLRITFNTLQLKTTVEQVDDRTHSYLSRAHEQLRARVNKAVKLTLTVLEMSTL